MVVFGMGVKVCNLLDPLPSWVRSHGAQVEDADSQRIVTLVREPIFDELVVINPLPKSFVVPRLLGRFKRRNIPYIRDWVAIRCQPRLVVFVVLVIRD